MAGHSMDEVVTSIGINDSTVTAAVSSGAMAANVGSCGWGSKVFDGQSGLAPQVLAATTNGTSGNQTFGITSGTSGCTQDGAVSSSWQTAMFIDGNKNALARDMSSGQGESLDALAALIGVESQDKETFARVTQENFSSIFTASDASAQQIRDALHSIVAADSTLLNRILSSLPLRAIGVVSFSLYLFHPLVLNILHKALLYYCGYSSVGFPIFFVTLCLSYLVACVMYTYIERPFLHLT